MKNVSIVIALGLLITSCSGGRNSTGYSIINDMKYSVAYEAQTSNPVFENGQTNQIAPAGTIPRGWMPEATDENGNPKIMENPYEMNDYAWERGEKFYNTMCMPCHGEKGLGDGLVVTRGGFPKPPSFKERRWKRMEQYPVGYMYNIISHGIGNMPSYKEQLYPEDRWYVAEYVRNRLMKRKK